MKKNSKDTKSKSKKVIKAEIVFKDKKRNLPKTLDRLNIFRNQTKFSTEFGSVELSKPLTQKDRDVIDAIVAVGEAGVKNGRKAYTFDPTKVLRMLGFEGKAAYSHHKWLEDKLYDIAKTAMRIEAKDVRLIGHVIDKVVVDYRVKELPGYLENFGRGYIWLLTFTEEFTEMYQRDYTLWSNQKTLKQIISIKQGYIKAIIRFCLTHLRINMKLKDLLSYVGYESITNRYYNKIKSDLIENAEMLKKEFNITVVEKNSDLFIFYKQNPRIIAIDYKPD